MKVGARSDRNLIWSDNAAIEYMLDYLGQGEVEHQDLSSADIARFVNNVFDIAQHHRYAVDYVPFDDDVSKQTYQEYSKFLGDYFTKKLYTKRFIEKNVTRSFMMDQKGWEVAGRRLVLRRSENTIHSHKLFVNCREPFRHRVLDDLCTAARDNDRANRVSMKFNVALPGWTGPDTIIVSSDSKLAINWLYNSARELYEDNTHWFLYDTPPLTTPVNGLMGFSIASAPEGLQYVQNHFPNLKTKSNPKGKEYPTLKSQFRPIQVSRMDYLTFRAGVILMSLKRACKPTFGFLGGYRYRGFKERVRKDFLQAGIHPDDPTVYGLPQAGTPQVAPNAQLANPSRNSRPRANSGSFSASGSFSQSGYSRGVSRSSGGLDL